MYFPNFSGSAPLLSQHHANHSSHGSMHSLDTEVVAGGPMDPYKENLRRVQSTDSLGSSLSTQQGLGGHNHKAKSASHLDESDFGPLVGADCSAADSSFGETSSIGSIKLPASHFLLTKDQEKAIKAMTPEQEETASLLSSISHAPDTAFLPPAGYRLVSDSEWNLLQQEVGMVLIQAEVGTTSCFQERCCKSLFVVFFD